MDLKEALSIIKGKKFPLERVNSVFEFVDIYMFMFDPAHDNIFSFGYAIELNKKDKSVKILGSEKEWDLLDKKDKANDLTEEFKRMFC